MDTVERLPKRESELITDVSRKCPHCGEWCGLLHGDGYHWCSECRGKLDKCEPGPPRFTEHESGIVTYRDWDAETNR